MYLLSLQIDYQKASYELHNPYEKILQRQFVNYLVILAHMIYKQDHADDGSVFSFLIED